ncbi:MAG: hypothetical protein WD990_03390 [Acidimicrobiia bacterium]
MRLLIIGVVAALTACGGSSSGTTTTISPETVDTVAFDPADLVTYESIPLGFEIGHPPDWTVSEVMAENLIGFTAPGSDAGLTPNFNVTVTEVTSDLPPAAYYEGEIERVTTSLENAEILEVADVNIDGAIGRGLTVVTRQADMDIGIARIIVIKDERAYELSFFARAGELERLSPMVTAIFRSLRWVS